MSIFLQTLQWCLIQVSRTMRCISLIVINFMIFVYFGSNKSTLFYGVLRWIGAVTEYPGMNDFVTISVILYLFMMTQEHCSIDSYHVIHDDAAT